MKRTLLNILTVCLLVLFACGIVNSQTVNRIKVQDLEKILRNTENKLFVINFWASWCTPCVEELPHFSKISEELKAENVKFIFISLDFPSQIESHLKPFLKKNRIHEPVFVMMDTDYDKWIGAVDSSWQGNIPATLFMNNSRKIRNFHPGKLDDHELRSIIKKLL